MNELEKYAAKKRVLARLKEILESGPLGSLIGRARKFGRGVAGKDLKAAKADHELAAAMGSGRSLTAGRVEKAEKASRKARLQLAGGAGALVGGGLLARRLLRGKRSGSKAMRFLKKNKMPLAVGGGVAGTVGALAALRGKRDR